MRIVETKDYDDVLTLYAIWEKLDAKDIVNTIISNSNVKGNIEFKDGINKNYTLDIYFQQRILSFAIVSNIEHKNYYIYLHCH